MVVLPSTRTPRLLVPVAPRRAGASSLLRYTAQQGFSDRLLSLGLAGGVRIGLCHLLPPILSGTSAAGGDTIDEHLGTIFGHPVVTSLAITAIRPNRKPVLQVFDTRGKTIAFAKVGVNMLTRALVDAEADALGQLASGHLPSVHVPRVLAHGRWRGNSVLVTTALPSGSTVPRDSRLVVRAMCEVSRVKPQSSHEGISIYLDGLRARADAVSHPARVDHVREWSELLDKVISDGPMERLSAGAWHGDWTSWNCAQRRGRLVVWDWERFTHPVPLGFDRLHFEMNYEIGERRDHFRVAATRLLARASDLLASWGLSAWEAELTAQLYILEIALRYLTDNPQPTGVADRVDEWAFPVLRAILAERH